MPIQDSDRFLIDDAGTSKKIRADKLKGGLDSTYANMKLLVNKPDYSSCFVYCSDLQTNLPDNHWMLVERAGVSYKVSGTEVHNYFPSGPAGATGVITNSHTTPITQGEIGTHDLTVASLANPNFVDNEAIRMIDADGNTASYVPETSAITNISEIPAPDTITYRVYKPTYTDCRTLAYTDGTDEQTLAPGIRPTVSGTFYAYFYKFDVDQIANIKEGDPNDIEFAFWYSDTGAANSWIYDTSARSSSGGATAFATKAAKYWLILRVAFDSTTPWQYNNSMESNKYAITDNPPGSVLTFADPCPDLKFFQPGDIVQHEGFGDGTVNWSDYLTQENGSFQTGGTIGGAPYGPVTYGFDGNTLSRPQANRSNSTDRMVFEPPAGTLTYKDRLEVFVVIDRLFKIYFNDDPDPVYEKFYDNNASNQLREWVTIDTVSDGSTKTIQKISMLRDAGDNYGFTALRIDGKILLDQDKDSGYVKVINRDPVARTMIVDGGLWSTGTVNYTELAAPAGTWSAYIDSNTPSGYSKPPQEIYKTDYMNNTSTAMNLVMSDSYNNYVWKVTADSTGMVIPEGVLFGVRATKNGGIDWRLEFATGPDVDVTTVHPLNNTPTNQIIFQSDGRALVGIRFSGSSVGMRNFYLQSEAGIFPFIDNETIPVEFTEASTKATGPSKFGTGKADGVPSGTTFRIKDSNGQWIDSTNRLGEQFYVKNGSGRVALSRLAT